MEITFDVLQSCEWVHSQVDIMAQCEKSKPFSGGIRIWGQQCQRWHNCSHQQLEWTLFCQVLSLTNDKFGVSSRETYFRTQQIHIKAGQHHHLKIVPIRHFATSSFKELSRDTRDCQLREENDESSVFRQYSQKGCIHECILRKMVSHERDIEFNF